MNFFELTGEQLSRIYTSLERVGEKEVRERLDGVGVGASLSLLREFYRDHPQDPFAEHHAAVAAWLVATVGPAVRETTDFELALTREESLRHAGSWRARFGFLSTAVVRLGPSRGPQRGIVTTWLDG